MGRLSFVSRVPPFSRGESCPAVESDGLPSGNRLPIPSTLALVAKRIEINREWPPLSRLDKDTLDSYLDYCLENKNSTPVAANSFKRPETFVLYYATCRIRSFDKDFFFFESMWCGVWKFNLARVRSTEPKEETYTAQDTVKKERETAWNSTASKADRMR